SALSRFAGRRHPVVNVRDGDWVVISARPIPGNERLVHHTIDNLYRNGAARVFYPEFEHVHVSGHAHRAELREMLRLVRPRFFVPVHGEYRLLRHHADLALAEGIPAANVLVLEDGRVVELTERTMEARDDGVAGLVFVDGLGIGDVEQVVLRDRRHLASDGMLVATVGIDRDTGTLRTGPELITRGFIEPELSEELMAEAREAVVGAVTGAGRRPDPTLLQEAIHDAVQRVLWKRTRRRPMVIPLLTEQ
ncbi:MAG TPA: ribonuclease J, partial [Candidatus Eisenbacteria bacterium]|nr:ribonuclease J [Candidatus Eisenbacteria bacterium]